MAKGASYTHLMSKKMRRTILRSPLQFLTMVLILALASTLFSGLYSSHLAFQKQIDQAYKQGNIADISTTLIYEEQSPDISKRYYDLISETVSGVGKVEGQYNASAKIHGLDATISLSDTYPTINKPIEIINDKTIEKSKYFYFCHSYLATEMSYGKRETWVDDDGNYQEIEIQLNNLSLKEYIDDNIDLKQAFANYTNEGMTNLLDEDYLTIPVTPTGSMTHPENIASNATNPFTFITTRAFINDALISAFKNNYDLDKLKSEKGEDQTLNECYDILTKSGEKITNKYWCDNRFVTRLDNRNQATTYRDKIADAITDQEDDNATLLYNIQLADTTSHQQLITDTMQSLQLCYVFPPIFFLVSILIVLTTISQIILKERKEIGTLKALGASNSSILAYYMGITGIVSFIGVAIGLIVGPLLLPMILDQKYKMLYTLPKLQYVFPTTIAIIMTCVVLFITMLVAFLIARKEAKALPVTSMRPKPVTIKKKNISETNEEEKTHKLCFKMAVRNIFCSIPRSVMVVIGVLGCTSLLCCGFGIDDSIQRGVENDTRMFFNTDSMIYFSNPTAKAIEEIPNLKTDDGTLMIDAYEPFGILPTNASEVGVIDKSFTTNIYSIPYALEQEYNFFNLGFLPRENEVAISNQIAKKLNLYEGDSIQFTFLGKTYTRTIAKVINVFYLHGIYIDGLSLDNPFVPTCGYARFNKEVPQKDIMEKIRGLEGVSNVLDYSAIVNQVANITSSIGYITITIKIFAILLAVVALYNLALLNFKENIRNIATMKVLGFNRREVAETLFFEIVTLSGVGALIGLALGWPLTRLVLGINQVPMCEFFYYVSAISFVASLLITLVVAAIINLFVGMRNKQIKMVESLKSVE